MYFKQRETDAEYAAAYIASHKKIAAERMKRVAALKKLKKGE